MENARIRLILLQIIKRKYLNLHIVNNGISLYLRIYVIIFTINVFKLITDHSYSSQHIIDYPSKIIRNVTIKATSEKLCAKLFYVSYSLNIFNKRKRRR